MKLTTAANISLVARKRLKAVKEQPEVALQKLQQQRYNTATILRNNQH